MYSCALMNGQHQQIGPPSTSMQAAAPPAYDTMRNQQAVRANNLCQYRTMNTGVQPPQNTLFTNRDVAYSNKQVINVPSITVPHQVFFSQQPTGVMNNNSKNAHNVQSGNPCFLIINGSQVSTQPTFYQNSAQNSKTQTPPSHPPKMTTYFQQNISALWSQPVTVNGNQSIRTQGGNVVSNFQQRSNQKSFHQNGNGNSTKAYPAHATMATSQLQNHLVYTCSLLPADAHNTQTAPNQSHGQNVTQHGPSPSISVPSYNHVVSQHFRDNGITTNSSSGGLMGHVLLSQKTPQHSAQLNVAHSNGGEATASIHSNSNSCRYEVVSVFQTPNEHPSNPDADAQQELLRRQTIARIEDNLRNSYTAGSDGCRPVPASSSCAEKPFVREVRMTESNQTVRPVTSTAAESCNPNALQRSLLYAGQSLPNTTQSVTSRTQHAVNAPPQQSSAPDVSVTTAGHRSGNGGEAGRAIFPKNDSASNGNPAGPLSKASQWAPLAETQKSVVNGQEILEKPSLVKASDVSIHSSPGRTAMRAVAVVQPLSQESYQAAPHAPHNISQLGERAAGNVSLRDPEKLISPTVAKNSCAANLKEGFNVNPENPDHMRSNKSVIEHSAASRDDAVVSSSVSAGSRELSQQPSSAKDKRYELAANVQLDLSIAPAARQSVMDEVPESENMDNNEMLADPKECVSDLSSVSTTPWKAVTLNNLIWLFEGETAQVARDSQDVTKFNPASKILSMFWDGSTKKLVDHLKSGMYKDLIANVREFCNQHVTQDSVILSQVKQGSGKHLQGYYVLKDDEVYSELPYRSSWLNVNEQVDDIDKDFGFSRYLTHRLHTSERGSKPDKAATVNSIPAHAVSGAPNKVLPQKELGPIASGEEKQASAGTKTSSPDRTESTDSCYSFEIQVLPPEEAKLIFEQLQSEMPQSKDADSPPEEVVKRPVEDRPPGVRDVTQSGSKVNKKGVAEIDQICCIARWIQQVVGSEGLQGTCLSKCQCKKEKCHNDSTDKPLDMKEMTVKKNDQLCGIRSGSESHFATKAENQAKAGENSDSQILTRVLPDLSGPTVDLTEDDENLPSHSGKETNNNSQMSLNDSQSGIIPTSENKHNNLSSSESDIPNLFLDFGILMSDPEEEEEEEEEEECVQGPLKSPGSSQSSTSGNSKMGIKKVFGEIASHMSDPGEDRAQAQLTSADVADVRSSLKTTEGETQTSTGAALRTTISLGSKHGGAERKRKTLSSHEGIFPFLKKLKKCRQPVHPDSQPVSRGVKRMTGSVDATDSKPSAPEVKTVELMLFGSAGKRWSSVAQRPPEVLRVPLSPHKRKPSVPTGEYSAKQRIYEKWRKSYPPPKMRHRRKPKTQYKCTFASLSRLSLKKVETASLPSTKEPPVPSERSVSDGNTKQHWLSWSKKRAHRLRLAEEKAKSDALRQPDQEGGADDKGHAVTCLKENSVLNFSVLPNTFSFVDGSNRRKRTARPVSDDSDLGESKDNISSETSTSSRGIWGPRPEKRYCPMRSHSVPPTSDLFHEFQKKYKEKKQPPATK